MLTAEGHVSEGSAENIFLFVNGELVTPPPTENILLGITRDTVMQIARRELDRITRERVMDRTELYCRRRDLPHRHRRPDCPGDRSRSPPDRHRLHRLDLI